jgi:hypothetical protein
MSTSTAKWSLAIHRVSQTTAEIWSGVFLGNWQCPPWRQWCSRMPARSRRPSKSPNGSAFSGVTLAGSIRSPPLRASRRERATPRISSDKRTMDFSDFEAVNSRRCQPDCRVAPRIRSPSHLAIVITATKMATARRNRIRHFMARGAAHPGYHVLVRRPGLSQHRL